MAKKRQQQWSEKSKTLPSASKRKEQIDDVLSRFKAGIRTKSKLKVKQKKFNYGPRIEQLKAKAQKTKPRFNPKNRDKLLEFGKETKKSRTRSERPKMYDEMVDNWDKTPESRRFLHVYNLSKYYESEDAKDKIARRKDTSGTYMAPTDSKYYIKVIRPYLAIKGVNVSPDKPDRIKITDDMAEVFQQAIIEYNISSDKSGGIKITKDMEELFQQASRNWLSNRISIEEFEQAFKVFEQGEELISDLYKGSKYNGTNVTEDDYKSMFYSIFRNMLQKSKSQYDSNTIRSYMLGNGIDEYVDGTELTPDKLDEIAKVMNPKIDLVRGDIAQLEDLLAGNTPTKKHGKLVDIKGDVKVGDDKTWFDDKDVMQYFKGYRLGDMKVDELEYLSEILPTKGELIKVQKLLARAKRKMNANFKHETVDLYERAASVIEDKGNTLGIDALTNELVDEINAMELLKNRGKW